VVRESAFVNGFVAEAPPRNRGGYDPNVAATVTARGTLGQHQWLKLNLLNLAE
jgi:hypothetical protein